MPELDARLLLCYLDDLDMPDSRGFTVSCGDRDHDIFVIRASAGVYGYLNSCPHTGAPLDWMPGQFLSHDLAHIQCATHAALFNLDDGACIAGPCRGDALSTVPLVVEAGAVYLLRREFCDR